MRLISEDVIMHKANSVRDMFGYSPSPSQAQVSSVATFIFYGYITEVHNLWLRNIDLSEVAHASSLANVTVAQSVWISNVTGTIAPLISRVKCRLLYISDMILSSEDTAALVQGMQNNVERVLLDGGGPVDLDIDTLLTYNGRGHCGFVQCYYQTKERYGDQLAAWGETMGWRVMEKDSCYVYIKR